MCDSTEVNEPTTSTRTTKHTDIIGHEHKTHYHHNYHHVFHSNWTCDSNHQQHWVWSQNYETHAKVWHDHTWYTDNWTTSKTYFPTTTDTYKKVTDVYKIKNNHYTMKLEKYNNTNELKTFCTAPIIPTSIIELSYNANNVVKGDGTTPYSQLGQANQHNQQLWGLNRTQVIDKYGAGISSCGECMQMISSTLLDALMSIFTDGGSLMAEVSTSARLLGIFKTLFSHVFHTTSDTILINIASKIGLDPSILTSEIGTLETSLFPNMSVSSGYYDNLEITFLTKKNNVYVNRNINVPIKCINGHCNIKPVNNSLMSTLQNVNILHNSNLHCYKNGLNSLTNKSHTCSIFYSSRAKKFTPNILFKNNVHNIFVSISSVYLETIDYNLGVNNSMTSKEKIQNINKNSRDAQLKILGILKVIVGFDTYLYDPRKSDNYFEYFCDINNYYALLCIRASAKITLLWDIIYAHSLQANIDVSDINFHAKFLLYIANNFKNNDKEINYKIFNSTFSELNINLHKFKKSILNYFSFIDHSINLTNIFIIKNLLQLLNYDLTKFEIGTMDVIKENVDYDIINKKVITIMTKKIKSLLLKSSYHNYYNEEPYGQTSNDKGKMISHMRTKPRVKATSTKSLILSFNSSLKNFVDFYNNDPSNNIILLNDQSVVDNATKEPGRPVVDINPVINVNPVVDVNPVLDVKQVVDVNPVVDVKQVLDVKPNPINNKQIFNKKYINKPKNKKNRFAINF